MKDKNDIICLTGLMGCGKTSVGKALASILACNFVDLDEYIVSKENKTIPEIFDLHKEEGFRRIESKCLKEIIDNQRITGERLILSLGGGCIIKDKNREIISNNTFCIYLKASISCLVEHLKHGANIDNRPLLNDSKDENSSSNFIGAFLSNETESKEQKLEKKLQKLLKERNDKYLSCSNIQIDVDGKSVEKICNEIQEFFTNLSEDKLEERDKFGLIGYPISQSQSPRLFNAGYHGKYQYDLIENPDFELAFNDFLLNYKGINITAPFKELAYKKADITSRVCDIIGACNILVKRNGKLYAYNSDYTGIKACLNKYLASYNTTPLDDLSNRSAKCLVLGCGGAGKAAVMAAIDSGLEVSLINRTKGKAETFAKHLQERFDIKIKVYDLSEVQKCIEEASYLIYTIPYELEGLKELLSARDSTGENANLVVLEANYKTPCLACLDNIQYIHGINWLLQQAVTGYFEFTGECPDEEAMKFEITH